MQGKLSTQNAAHDLADIEPAALRSSWACMWRGCHTKRLDLAAQNTFEPALQHLQ